MKRSKQHEILKSRERGNKEKPTRGGRFDASTIIKVVEIERTGSSQRLEHAILKLKKSTKPQKILRVPNHNMKKAKEIAKKLGANLTITNLGKTKRVSTK